MENTLVPDIYYWEDIFEGKPQKMTCAFRWKEMLYGLSYPVPDTEKAKFEHKRNLAARVWLTLDVFIHHGQKVLDKQGNIDYNKVLDEEAIRFKFDPLWERRVKALQGVMRVKEITREKAKELRLL